jgi:hypothetical protein
MYEGNLMIKIAEKFEFEFPLSDNVHAIDREMLLREWENLVVNEHDDFECWDHARAKKEFLNMYKVLFEETVVV